jgi:predicted DNA repair protein MutK
MSKVATKETGFFGDDLAVNAEASSFVTDRKLPVLWTITKGSFFSYYSTFLLFC